MAQAVDGSIDATPGSGWSGARWRSVREVQLSSGLAGARGPCVAVWSSLADLVEACTGAYGLRRLAGLHYCMVWKAMNLYEKTAAGYARQGEICLRQKKEGSSPHVTQKGRRQINLAMKTIHHVGIHQI